MLATKTALTTVENKIPDVSTLATKTSLSSLLPVHYYGNEITKIENDYVTNASLDSKLNDLKAQHISTEVKKIDDKTKRNTSDILRFENRLKQKKDIVDDYL